MVHMVILALFFLGQLTAHTSLPTPREAVNGLLAADNAFADAARRMSTADALAAMFAEDVIAPVPGNVYVQGKDKVVEALRANPDNLDSRAEWAPIRGGISADGLHGFTFGYMTVVKKDDTRIPLKYLAYWIKGTQGWRVAAYRRRPRPEGHVALEMMPPAIPEQMVAPDQSPERLHQHASTLSAIEQAFSDEAQKIGIGAAFAKYGRADAINMGGPKDHGFVVGAEAIGRSVGAGTATDSSEVEWNADRVLVASSGDLGITFGMIRLKKPEPNSPKAVPFFTIWRRDSSSGTWRYIAE
jgi:ketosteroid isomerase-like protein